MRLLNVQEVLSSEAYDVEALFTEIYDPEIFVYTVLSHRWADFAREEVSYQDLLQRRNLNGKGFEKIRCACETACAHGFAHIWIDTCCIDKTSSAELTEAINSMWSWYRMANECYVYLVDLPELSHDGQCLWTTNSAGNRCLRQDTLGYLKESKWFTRGWTLQELLAPDHVLFLNVEWKPVATKTELTQELSFITRIPKRYLTRPNRLLEASVAMRMSWVSRRRTTRIEDMAYCLLGILNVNMPLLYGEGRKAFMRLQLEIIKKNRDDSIFAWATDHQHQELLATLWPTLNADERHRGLLALWPTAFAGSGSIVRFKVPDDFRFTYSMTNHGMELRCSNLSEVGSDDEENVLESPETQSQADIGADWQGSSRTELRNYQSVRTAKSDQKRPKKFRLTCGDCGEADMDVLSNHELRRIAQRNVICVVLTIKGSEWRRVSCDGRETRKKYLKGLTAAHSVIYVPQDGM